MICPDNCHTPLKWLLAEVAIQNKVGSLYYCEDCERLAFLVQNIWYFPDRARLPQHIAAHLGRYKWATQREKDLYLVFQVASRTKYDLPPENFQHFQYDSPRDIFDAFLSWHGILGFSNLLFDVVRTLDEDKRA